MQNKDQILKTFTANVKSEQLGKFLDEIDEVILKALSESFQSSGHWMTGKLISDIETEVEANPGKLVIDYLSYKYGAYLNSGVSADRIPFNPGSGYGKSLYITGLMNYAKNRMGITSSKEQLSVAFAIAHKQKQSGMPLRTKGQGTKWADEVPDKVTEQVAGLFSDLNETYIFQSLTQVFQKYNNAQ